MHDDTFPRMIYLDNAASTRAADEVLALVADVSRHDFANPSAAHPGGAAARRRIAIARGQVMAALGGGDTDELIWTSGGTEANAIAVLGGARARPPGDIVVSALEHPAVAASAELAGADYPVRTAPVLSSGIVDVDRFVALVTAQTRVAAIMLVSNELGTAQPVAELARAVRARAPACHLHCDATQAVGKVAVDVAALGVDSVAIAGHKFHGCKGTGALWLGRGAAVAPLFGGGGQQRGLRPGTQDTAGAAGLGLAVERAVEAMPAAIARWGAMADLLYAAAAATGVPWRALAGDRRAAHIVSLGFDRVAADGLRNMLASRGVIVSSGSACAGPSGKPAGALAAIGLAPSWGMVRLSFGLDTELTEVERAGAVLTQAVRDLAR